MGKKGSNPHLEGEGGGWLVSCSIGPFLSPSNPFIKKEEIRKSFDLPIE